MSKKDSSGYYAILGVSHSATSAQIRTAFRRRAKELHPDRNPSSNATKDFQLLNEAYSVLNDPVTRSQYDTSSIETPKHEKQSQEKPPEPIVCSVCEKVSAQPRYVIFYEVKSFIVWTTVTPIQGIFCSTCAERKSLKATAITWALGWWAFPWGLIRSPYAIFVNLIGGKQPADVNARLAAYQAWAFMALGKLEIGRAIALDALDLSRKIKIGDKDAELRKGIEELLLALGPNDKVVRLRDSWSLFRRSFYIQGLVALTVIGAIWFAILNDMTGSTPLPRTRPYTANRTATPSPPGPVYVRPATAPNEHPWPFSTGYISGYAKLHVDGLSTVTIDNSQNASDVMGKLVSLDATQAVPVRIFFISGHGSFKLNKVTAGTYDIRYRDLDSGGLSRSESFILEEDGTRFSNLTMTLYKVLHGNMQTYGLAEDDF